MKRLIFPALVLLVLSATVTACVVPTVAPAPGGAAPAQKPLVMGTESTFPPYEFRNEKNEVVGFDIDLANAIAQKLGRELKIEDMAFDALIPALLAGKIDMIVAGMTITEERKKKVAFSDPYYETGLVWVVRADDDRMQTPDDLKGKTLSTQTGTTSDIQASKIEGVNMKRFQQFTDAFLEVSAGRADACIVNEPTAIDYTMKHPELKIGGKLQFEGTERQFNGIAVRLEDEELLNAINQALQELQDSGEYDKMVEKWFGAIRAVQQKQ
jgi:polar amino acid transport system substrate-binding protein